MESTFQDLDSNVHQATELEVKRARTHGDLVWADGHIFAYRYHGKIYIMEPPTELLETLIPALEAHMESQGLSAEAPVESCCDRAVLEAGFGTEPHRSLIERLMLALQARMVGSTFTLTEHELVMEAKAFLIGAEHG